MKGHGGSFSEYAKQNKPVWEVLVTQSCLTLCDPIVCSLPVSSVCGCLWDFPGKNTGIGRHSLLQGIFLTLGLNPHLLDWQAGSLPLSHLGSQYVWVYCPLIDGPTWLLDSVARYTFCSPFIVNLIIPLFSGLYLLLGILLSVL